MLTNVVGKVVRDRMGVVLGTVVDVIPDPVGMEIEWVRVRPRRFGTPHLVPVGLLREVGPTLMVDADADTVRDAPSVSADVTPSRAEREALAEHYRQAPRPVDEIDLRDEVRPLDGARTAGGSLLVLLNEPIGAGLLAEIEVLSGGNPADLEVIVPEVHAGPDDLAYLHSEGLDGESPGVALAGIRAYVAAEQLERRGHRVHVEVIETDPVAAVQLLAEERPDLDGLVVSTPHAGPSRWFHQDLPSQLARIDGLPVLAVVVDDEPVASTS